MTSSQSRPNRIVDSKRRSSRYRLTTRLIAIPVCLIALALIRKAWLDLDTAWDSLAYHLPFAALRTGILSPSQYHLSKWIGACYAGFPVVPDYLKGWLWQLSGRPQAANLLGLSSLLVLGFLLRKSSHIPITDSLLAFFAIPIVLIQSTSTYNDLFANSVMVMLLIIVLRGLIFPASFSYIELLGACVAAGIVTNCKLQFLPLGAFALTSLAGVLYLNRARLVRMRAEFRRARVWMRVGFVITMTLVIALSYVKSIENLLVFKNPAYPVAIKIGPLNLEGQFNAFGTEPQYLSDYPQPVRWALSVLEYSAFDGRRILWTNGQGDVQINSKALRMGGFFSAYVMLNLLGFLFLQLRLKRFFGWKPAIFLFSVTVVTAFLPASQELRYYLYWMLTLVALNLTLIFRGLRGEERLQARIISLAACTSCLLFVLSSTDAFYLRSTGIGPLELTRGNISDQLTQMHMQAGEAVCVLGKNPSTFLYAPIFNPSIAATTRYELYEAYSREDCADKRLVP